MDTGYNANLWTTAASILSSPFPFTSDTQNKYKERYNLL